MNKYVLSTLRFAADKLFNARNKTTRIIKKIAKTTKNKKILEIGSGKCVNKKYPYSYAQYFKAHNEFITSDINPSFGHKIIDITKMNSNNEYDMIICLNVLEHIYEFEKAVQNMYNALRDSGDIIVIVPFLYPLHDEPIDFFRYTEHSLRIIFKNFNTLSITWFGLRRLPTAYFLAAKKLIRKKT
jgi:SAM-dependent methyltransferase